MSADGAAFGEIELPRELPVPPPPPPISGNAQGISSADFVDLELDDKPRSRGFSSPRPPPPPPPPRPDSSRGAGGMTFGEVDFASPQSSAGQIAISVDGPPAEPPPPPSGGVRVSPSAAPALTAPVHVAERGPVRVRPSVPRPKRPIGKRLAQVALVAAILAGASLQLTSYGAYGYLYVGDLVSARQYERATLANVGATEKALGIDTYDQAKTALEAVAGAHARLSRAKALTAYAAIVDSAITVRFGPDVARAPRAKELVAELGPDEGSLYRDIAIAAQAAADGDLDKARKGLTAGSARNAQDPIQTEVALLLGEVALAARDGAAALVAFRHAQERSNDARAHFGLARAYDATRDAANAKIEIDATLVQSPQHPGALTLRARMKSAPTEEAQALRDLATVVDGAARAKASPAELSRACSARAWVSFERGSPSEARDWFAKAIGFDPRNTGAISGEGRLFLNEGRFTEALARFDTTLQLEPNSPEAIANDAEAKLALERLADAKRQLVEARERFPRSVPIVVLLGKVEQHLGNNEAAETDLRAAVAIADPTQRDAVLPYVALSELLSSRGKLVEAKAVLDDAKKKLVASSALDRALGEVADLQGENDAAIAYYRAAIAKDPKDLAARFRLAVTLRRVRKFADADAELNRVAAVDKDYPGLSLERGLLFEESGDVQKAIEQFKAALARAPDDPDLQLRVGSAYVAIGRPDDAIPMLRKVLQGRPTSAEAHHYLGRALMLRGPSQQAEALRYLKRAVDLDPNRAEFHVYLAWAANEATPAQLELARDEIERALSLDKLNAESYWQKGVLERMQGAIEDAINDERRALDLRPSRYEAHATLAECYEDRNDEATAMAEWAKAVASDNASTDDGGVRHPYWRYKYGKLLMMRGSVPAALKLLLPAATTVEKSDQRPGWMAPLEFLTGEALRKVGRKAEAVEHYRRFMDVAPVTSPDRSDAQEQLKRLTGHG
jgi:tetratricopeptide (TPR) repeat protein